MDIKFTFGLLFTTSLQLYVIFAQDTTECPASISRNKYLKSYRDHCYRFVDDQKDWNDARQDCRNSEGGDLALVLDPDTQNFVVDSLKNLSWSPNGIWIGATDIKEEGKWLWVTGKPVTYGHWRSGYGPENTGLFSTKYTSDCAQIRQDHNYKWEDYPCAGGAAYHYTYICQYDKIPVTTSLPQNFTTETQYSTTTKEVSTKSAPLPAAVKSSRAPQCPPNEGHLVLYEELCLYLVEDEVVWNVAKSNCERNGGSLIEITESFEQVFLEYTFGQLGWNHSGAWIGASNKQGQWTWVSGKPMNYSFWGLGYGPGNKGTPPPVNKCAKINLKAKSQWEDTTCDQARNSYICQNDKQVLTTPRSISTRKTTTAPQTTKTVTSIPTTTKRSTTRPSTTVSTTTRSTPTTTSMKTSKMVTTPSTTTTTVDYSSINDTSACPQNLLRGQYLRSFRGHCYQLINAQQTWGKASKACKDFGGKLVQVLSPSIQNFVVKSLNDFGFSEAWIGANDTKEEGTWLWESGKAVTYENWGTGYGPNNTGLFRYIHDCAKVGADGLWKDASCSDHNIYICEFEEASTTGTTFSIEPSTTSKQITTTSSTEPPTTTKSTPRPTTTSTTVPSTTAKPTTRPTTTSSTVPSTTTKPTTKPTTTSTTVSPTTTKPTTRPTTTSSTPTTIGLTTEATTFVVQPQDTSECPASLTRNKYLKSFRDHCYRFVDDQKVWDDARRDCRNSGSGDLAQILDQETQNFVVNSLKNLNWNHNGIWIGATDIKKEGTWLWVTGKPVSYGNWRSGYGPEKTGIFTTKYTDDCAQIRKDQKYKWEDFPCTGGPAFHYTYLCQYDKVLPTTASLQNRTDDTLLSTVPQQDTTTRALTSPTTPPTIPPTTPPTTPQTTPPTTPIKTTTSKHVTTESTAIPATFNPFAIASCPPYLARNEYLREFKGHCYQFVDALRDWDGAGKACKAQNGELVQILDPDTQNFIVKSLNALGFDDMWIGANDVKEEGKWLWETGDNVTYGNWGQGYGPNNTGLFNILYDCAKVGPDGLWKDEDCSRRIRYICEFAEVQTTSLDKNVSSTVASTKPTTRPTTTSSTPQSTTTKPTTRPTTTSSTVSPTTTKPTTRPTTTSSTVPSTTTKPTTRPTTTSSTVPSTTAKPTTRPTTTSSTVPSTTTKPTTRPTTTSSTVPSTTTKPTTRPATTSSTIPLTSTKPTTDPTKISQTTTFDKNSTCPPSLPRSDHLLEFGDECLHFVEDPISWFDAERHCEKDGGHLIEIFDPVTQMFVSSILDRLKWNNTGVWIGASDEVVEGDWKWKSGASVSYGNWREGFGPNNAAFLKYIHNCATMSLKNDGQWEDVLCTDHNSYICQYGEQKTTNPATTSSTMKPSTTPITSKPTTAPTTIKPTISPTTLKPTTSPTTTKPTSKSTTISTTSKLTTSSTTMKTTAAITSPTTTKTTIKSTTIQTTTKPTTAPTTAKPTTAPTTSKQTTAPTTAKPTTTPTTTKQTSTPTTTKPTTAPTTAKPSTTPTTYKQTTAPTTAKPTTTPTTSKQTTAPTTAKPTTTPTTSKQTTAPTTAKPTTTPTTAKQTTTPTTTKPTTAPTTAKPTTTPTTAKQTTTPTTTKPTTAPTTAKPTKTPTTAKPTTTPTTAKSTTAPTTAKPTTKQTTTKPTTAPTTAKPTSAPTTAKPTTAPTTAEPTTTPTTAKPTTTPTTTNPTTTQTSAKPTKAPTTNRPTTTSTTIKPTTSPTTAKHTTATSKPSTSPTTTEPTTTTIKQTTTTASIASEATVVSESVDMSTSNEPTAISQSTPGKTGNTQKNNQKKNDDDHTEIVIAAVVGGVILLIIITALLCMIRRRFKGPGKERIYEPTTDSKVYEYSNPTIHRDHYEVKLKD